MEQNRNNEVAELDLLQIFQTLWDHIWVILVATAIGAAALFSYASFFITPTYQASTSLFVNNSTISFGGTSLVLQGSDLLETYAVILKSRVTLNDVIDDMGLKYSYGQLKGMISTSAVNDTQVFQITVTSSDAREAEQIANKLADIMPEKITSIMDGCSVRVVDYAVVPSGKIAPNISRYTLVGALIGFVAAAAFVILRSMLDTAIYDEEFLEQRYNIPVLTVVPELLNSSGSSYYNYKQYGTDYRSSSSRGQSEARSRAAEPRRAAGTEKSRETAKPAVERNELPKMSSKLKTSAAPTSGAASGARREERTAAARAPKAVPERKISAAAEEQRGTKK